MVSKCPQCIVWFCVTDRRMDRITTPMTALAQLRRSVKTAIKMHNSTHLIYTSYLLHMQNVKLKFRSVFHYFSFYRYYSYYRLFLSRVSARIHAYNVTLSLERVQMKAWLQQTEDGRRAGDVTQRRKLISSCLPRRNNPPTIFITPLVGITSSPTSPYSPSSPATAVAPTTAARRRTASGPRRHRQRRRRWNWK